jgi:hypothetical protein
MKKRKTAYADEIISKFRTAHTLTGPTLLNDKRQQADQKREQMLRDVIEEAPPWLPSLLKKLEENPRLFNPDFLEATIRQDRMFDQLIQDKSAEQIAAALDNGVRVIAAGLQWLGKDFSEITGSLESTMADMEEVSTLVQQIQAAREQAAQQSR